MAATDSRLLAETQHFAAEVADLISSTVSPDASVLAITYEDRIWVAPHNESGDRIALPLTVDGTHRLDLKIHYRCT